LHPTVQLTELRAIDYQELRRLLGANAVPVRSLEEDALADHLHGDTATLALAIIITGSTLRALATWLLSKRPRQSEVSLHIQRETTNGFNERIEVRIKLREVDGGDPQVIHQLVEALSIEDSLAREMLRDAK
jgi:hypothetical protein